MLSGAVTLGLYRSATLAPGFLRCWLLFRCPALKRARAQQYAAALSARRLPTLTDLILQVPGRSLLPQEHLECKERWFKVSFVCLMCTGKTCPLQDALCAGLRQSCLEALLPNHPRDGRCTELFLGPAQGPRSVA